MNLRIWQYGKDDTYIRSWLEGQALAHHSKSQKSPEWFHWKFEQSPYGKALLACAFDDNIVAGCVAYGMGVIKYNDKEYPCALSYETFVRPDYQGQGLFKKLIQLAEDELRKEGRVKFLYNYPNSNSLTGFKHMGWIERNDLQTYRIRIERPFHLTIHCKDLKKAFLPNPSNLNAIINTNLSDIPTENVDKNIVLPVWTTEYLKWRFFTFPNREYHIINNPNYFAISMVGYRGKLKDIHLLYAISKNPKVRTSSYIKDILKHTKRELKPDFISYSTTINDELLKQMKGFINVPSHSNFCYKVLDSSINIDNLKASLPSINAHTY